MWKDQIEKKIINQKREVESSPAYAFESLILGVSKKTRKPIKPRKPEKNNRKNWTEKKNRLNRLNFWKNRPVRFRFYKQKPKKPNRTEPKPTKNRAKPSQNRAKPEKTEPNRFEPVFSLQKPNRTEPKPVGLTRFRFGFGFFSKKKYFGLVTFFDKNRTEPKMITPTWF